VAKANLLIFILRKLELALSFKLKAFLADTYTGKFFMNGKLENKKLNLDCGIL
jgi:hypothetical protein